MKFKNKVTRNRVIRNTNRLLCVHEEMCTTFKIEDTTDAFVHQYNDVCVEVNMLC